MQSYLKHKKDQQEKIQNVTTKPFVSVSKIPNNQSAAQKISDFIPPPQPIDKQLLLLQNESQSKSQILKASIF